jgi:hypothetical protein
MKAFILYIKEPNSLKYAKECADSCNEHGVKFELVEGYYGVSYSELMQTYKYPIQYFDDPFSHKGRLGNAICGHMKIYNKIVEYGKPAALLEHDNIVKRDFSELQIPEDNSIYYISMKVYDKNHYTPPNDDFTFIKLPTNFIIDNANAEILSPTAAKFLIDYYNNMKDYEDWYKMYNSGLTPFIIDPVPVINNCGNFRVSTVSPNLSTVFNAHIPESFYKNLTDPNLRNLYKETKIKNKFYYYKEIK